MKQLKSSAIAFGLATCVLFSSLAPAWAATDSVDNPEQKEETLAPDEVEEEEEVLEESTLSEEELESRLIEFSKRLLILEALNKKPVGLIYDPKLPAVPKAYLSNFYKFEVFRDREKLPIDVLFPMLGHEDRLVEFRDKILLANRIRQILTWVGGIGTPAAGLAIFVFPNFNTNESLAGSLLSIMSIAATFIFASLWEYSYSMKYAPIKATDKELREWVKVYNLSLMKKLELRKQDVEYIYNVEP